MEKASQSNFELLIQEILKSPIATESLILTQHTIIKEARDILRDLSWGRGGQLDPHLEEYVVKLVNLMNKVMEDT